MNTQSPDEWICRAHCSFYKTDRTEEEHCRGYTLADLLSQRRELTSAQFLDRPFDPSFKASFFRRYVCDACPFLIDGCDFTSDEPPEGAPPCGGLIVLSKLLSAEKLEDNDIIAADALDVSRKSYLSPTPHCTIKRLEEDYLYHVARDELYEINDEALEMLLKCDGSLRTEQLDPDPDFLWFCFQEDLLEVHENPRNIPVVEGSSPVPSLRYLEWLITFRCNLSCAHCYLGEPTSEEFPPQLIRSLLGQFSRMQGLRILVSGGEPTLYRHFDVLNRALTEFPIRAVLLTNGIALDERLASELNFHEVQISLDGMEAGHDAVRGKGSFRRAVRAMKAVRDAGLDLSIATMIHSRNLDEWSDMHDLITEMGAREWSVDYPCVKGRWEAHPELAVGLEEASEKMAFGYGGSYHGTSPGWTCGRHLAAVLPSGNVCKCGLYPDRCYGHVSQGLAEAWSRVEHIPIDHTECRLCAKASVCGGGCRYRAGGANGRDEVMCLFHKVLP